MRKLRNFAIFGFLLVFALTPAMMSQQTQGAITTNSTDCSTARSCVQVNINGGKTVGVGLQIAGTFTGTISFEATVDGSNWKAISGTLLDGTATATSATATGAWQFGAAGLIAIRARGSAAMTGGANVTFSENNGQPQIAAASIGSSVTANAGSGTFGNNIAQIAGQTATTVGNGILKVAIVDSTGGTIAAVTDPCNGLKKTPVPFTTTSATVLQLVAATTNNVYVCSFSILVGGGTGATQTVAIAEDDTAACASPIALLNGGGTATGQTFLGGGGMAFGAGIGAVMQTTAISHYVCIITTTTARTDGQLLYVAAP